MSTNGTKIVGLDQMEYEARLILRQTSAICGRLGTAVEDTPTVAETCPQLFNKKIGNRSWLEILA